MKDERTRLVGNDYCFSPRENSLLDLEKPSLTAEDRTPKIWTQFALYRDKVSIFVSELGMKLE